MAENRNQKKINTASAREMGQTASSSALTPKEALSVALFGVLLFAAMTVQTGRMSLVLCGFALLSAVAGKKPFLRLAGAVSVPVVGLLAFGVMQGLAAIYTPFDDVAAGEFGKLLAAFSLAVILLTRFERRHIPGLLWAVTAVGAAISLLSVDLDAAGVLFAPFNALSTALGYGYSDLLGQMNGNRITGLYKDANVNACLSGMAALLGLHLMRSQEKPTSKLCAAVLCGINAMAFFLCMSRGAILCFAVACAIWLVAAGKGSRISLFLSMFVCGVVTVALSVPAMRTLNGVSALPTILTVLCGAVIFGVDFLLTARLSDVLTRHRKLAVGALAALAVLCVGYGAASMVVTGPATITSQYYELLSRSVDLPAGDYTLSGEWEPLRGIRVIWLGKDQGLMGNYRELYWGDADTVSFTVPEDGGRTSIEFRGEVGTVISSAVLSNGTELKLNRLLIPDFLEDRLQDDLLTSKSFLQRAEYVKDGLTIFLKSPLIGSGLGATENLTRGVQRFAYESKYSHNHVLQVLCESGILGLAAFLTLLGGSLWMAFCHRKEDTDGLIPVFFAVWTLMNLHSLMEISFSLRAFQCFTFVVLLLPAVQFAAPVEKGRRAAWSNRAKKTAAVLLLVYVVVFGGLLESHRMVERELEAFQVSSLEDYFTGLERFISRDVFDRESMELNYAANALSVDNAHIQKKSADYVQSLRKGGTYTACSGLARYYYLPLEQWEDLFAVSREGLQQVASSPDGWNLQLNFYRNEVLPAMGAERLDDFLAGLDALRDALNAQNEKMLEPLTLSEENETFLNLVDSVIREKLEPAAAFLVLNQGA